MVEHLHCEIPMQCYQLFGNSRLRYIPDVVASAAEDDVPPYSHSICQEKHHRNHDKIVIPAEVAAEVAGPNSAGYEEEWDDGEDTNNSKDLMLSTFDHDDCGSDG
jgi:hypothetical protein